MTDKLRPRSGELSDPERSPGSISKGQLLEDLRHIGVCEGDHIAVALSLRRVGTVQGRAEAFIDALLEAVGSGGTIMMNSHTPFFPVSQIESSDPKYIFDYRSTPTWTGVVPEALRNRRAALRSRHPICSVVAMGAKADHLAGGHDEDSPPYSPYSRLAEIGGKLLYVGLDDRMVAMRHEAQNLAGLMDVVPLEVAIRYLNPEDGRIELFRATNVFSCVNNLSTLVPALRGMGLIVDGKIGAADSILAPAKAALLAMAEILRGDPTKTLCRDFSCVWCRELERRMDLRERIEDPEIFQKSRALMEILGIINQRRMRGSWAAIKGVGLLKKIF